jgi:hypothetical protein
VKHNAANTTTSAIAPSHPGRSKNLRRTPTR